MNIEHETKLHELESLERVICKGLATYDERNRLIVRLVEQGVRQAEITRRLNKVRQKMNVATITPDAVAATMRRVYKKERQ